MLTFSAFLAAYAGQGVDSGLPDWAGYIIFPLAFVIIVVCFIRFKGKDK
jgi:hypothetical protein